MSISSRSRCSMMKQSGALMSSRLIAHRVDEGVDVLGVDFEVDRIDVGEALEQHRLAFHHRLRGKRPEVAEAEDRRAVRDHRDEVAAGCVVEGLVGVGGDGLHRHRDPRRIGQRQIALGGHRLGRDDLELPRLAVAVEEQRLLVRQARSGGLGALRHWGLPARLSGRWPPPSRC
jgi:hypothetical protein